jgi:hypothetical protein
MTPRFDGIFRAKETAPREIPVRVLAKPVEFTKKKRSFRFPTRLFIAICLLFIAAGGFFAIRRPLSALLPKVQLAALARDGRYLVLFQNDTELRPSGGFLGSFAEVTIQNGYPIAMDFETNIYKLDKAFTDVITVDPPDPLLKIIEKWAMRDSNWAADFKDAAQKVEWFYQQEGGRGVDGVIAINTRVAEDLLKLTGPIEMPEYNTTITAENFLPVVQYKVEKEYFENPENFPANEPKSILKDMAPKLLEKAMAVDKRALYQLFDDALAEKNLLFYFRNPDLQKIAEEQNWAGRIRYDAAKDYLYIVNANVGGKKSSRNIDEKVSYSVVTKTREATLEITRTHKGTGEWPDGENKNYMRVLVPKGSELIFGQLNGVVITDEVDVSEESGLTSFGLWVNTAPGSVSSLTLTYRLSLNAYPSALRVQHQPGANPDQMSVWVDGKRVWEGILGKDSELSIVR